MGFLVPKRTVNFHHQGLEEMSKLGNILFKIMCDGFMIDWLIDWEFVRRKCTHCCSIDPLIDWLIDWLRVCSQKVHSLLFDWFIDWLIENLFAESALTVVRLIHWLTRILRCMKFRPLFHFQLVLEQIFFLSILEHVHCLKRGIGDFSWMLFACAQCFFQKRVLKSFETSNDFLSLSITIRIYLFFIVFYVFICFHDFSWFFRW